MGIGTFLHRRRRALDAALRCARSRRAKTRKFVLSLNALLTQKSGEDWENVALKLSTARPGMGSLPPKLEPIWVDEPTRDLSLRATKNARAGGWHDGAQST